MSEVKAHLGDGGRGGAEGLPVRYLTAAIPGTGGRIKERPDDFLVEEIPAYEPCGSGEHLYLFVEKRNYSTLHVARLLADHFGVRRDAVGMAGLKDKFAVTRQLFSVHTPGKGPDDFPAFSHDGVVIHWVDRHTNKLRRGHLRGNRFIIRIRGVDPSRVVLAYRSLTVLGRGGVPNRIGEQRFGHMRNNHMVGLALVRGDWQGVLDTLLGPSTLRTDAQVEGRKLYAEGKFAEAIDAFPRSLHTERRVLAALARGAKPKGAVTAIERVQRSFYLTALQSAVFNRVLEHRLETSTESGGGIAALHAGDLAFKHDSGAVFPVREGDDAAELIGRAAAFEISPSGPMWGHRMARAAGKTDEVEVAALAEFGLTPESLADHAAKSWDPEPGERRPLRIPLTQPDVEGGVDEHGPYVKCVFELPRGSFATTVMEEVMKCGGGGWVVEGEQELEEDGAPG
ncbi:MAG: tRNA pseudouridine(13) synthase TruD [Phycisphaerales bacterium]|nr:tRNA pseudouridine(13) synthase TruD [Phycisphaerales bacterium]